MNHTFDNLWNLGLSFCNISEFLRFLLTSSKDFFSLDLSNNQIHGSVPNWLSKVGKNLLSNLNLSHSFLTHIEQLTRKELRTLDLSFNLFSRLLQIFSLPFLWFFSMSKNQFGGEIPTLFCNMTFLQVLDLSSNHLSGNIPKCMGNLVKISQS